MAGTTGKTRFSVLVHGDRSRLAMVVIAAIVTIALICLSVVLWLKFRRTAASDGRARRVFGAFGVLTVLVAAATIILVVANATTVASPAPALLALFNGGW